jgi:hypothetical protein
VREHKDRREHVRSYLDSVANRNLIHAPDTTVS